jgi:hypothetical protein
MLESGLTHAEFTGHDPKCFHGFFTNNLKPLLVLFVRLRKIEANPRFNQFGGRLLVTSFRRAKPQSKKYALDTVLLVSAAKDVACADEFFRLGPVKGIAPESRHNRFVSDTLVSVSINEEVSKKKRNESGQLLFVSARRTSDALKRVAYTSWRSKISCADNVRKLA